VLGKRWFGLRGAVAAFLGMFALPFVWVLGLAMLFTDISSNKLITAVVMGVGAAGAGLFIGTAIKLGKPLARKPAALAITAGCFLAVAIGRVSLLIVLPTAVAIAMFLAAKRRL
jgi:chromate transporter